MAGTVSGNGNNNNNNAQETNSKTVRNLNNAMKKAEETSQQKAIKNITKQEEKRAQLRKKAEEEILNDTEKKVKKTWEEIGKDFGENVVGGVRNLFSGITHDFSTAMTDYFGAYSDSMSLITTRLLGTAKDYQSVFDTIQSTVSGTSAVSVLTVMKSLEKLVQTGISANLEQRAFLDSVSDKIATTFDATNATLLQISRLNRYDSTAAYLGLEASLTEYFNSQFSDTNFLTSGLNDSISSAIYEATAQLGTTMGAEFEFQVQKWLGSFYEAGMNSATIQNLATAIGYLGSGNSNALMSNNQLNSMMAMASNYAGLDYSRLLTQGITASDVNALMQGVYRQGIAMANSGDMVARNQYASLFGMTSADLQALASLSRDDLDNIASIAMSYDSMLDKTDYELTQIANRTSIKQKIDNVISNVMSQAGESIASSAGQYITYMLADMIGPVNVPTPFIGNIDITGLVKTGIVGINMLSNLGTVLNALAGNDTIQLSDFDTSYGGGNGFISGADTQATLTQTTGVRNYIATSDSDKLLRSSIVKEEGATQIIGDTYATDEKTLTDVCDIDNQILEILVSIDDRLNNLETGFSTITVDENTLVSAIQKAMNS